MPSSTPPTDDTADSTSASLGWRELCLAAGFTLWLMVGVAGPYTFNGALAEAIVGVAVIVPLATAIFTGAIVRALTTETATLIAALVIPAAISTMIGYADMLTVFAIAILPAYVLSSAAVVEVRDQALRIGLRAVAVAALVTLIGATFAAHQERFLYGQFAAWERLSAGRHPNYVGLTALVGMIAAIAWRGVIRVALMVGFLWITFLAQSRMTLICMLICIVAVAIDSLPRLMQFGRRFPRLMPAMVVGGIIATVVAIAFILAKLAYLSSLGGRDVSDMGGRTRIWSIALDFYARAPWFGYGYRSQSTQNLLGAYYSHNMWLSSLVEIGAIGTLAFLAVYVAAIVFAVRNLRRGLTVRICLVTLLVYLIYGIAEGRYINTGNPLSVLFLFAVSYAFALNHQSRVENESHAPSPLPADGLLGEVGGDGPHHGAAPTRT